MKKILLTIMGICTIFQFGFAVSCLNLSFYKIDNKKINYNTIHENILMHNIDIETFKDLDGYIGIDKIIYIMKEKSLKILILKYLK